MEPLDREVLALRHFEGLSNAETATVWSSVFRRRASVMSAPPRKLRLIMVELFGEQGSTPPMINDVSSAIRLTFWPRNSSTVGGATKRRRRTTMRGVTPSWRNKSERVPALMLLDETQPADRDDPHPDVPSSL